MAIIGAPNGGNLTLKNVSFRNAPGFTAIKGKDLNLISEGVSFHNVGRAYDLEGGTADIRNNIITEDEHHRGQRIEQVSSNKARIGWEPSHHPPMPVFCRDCKSIFPSQHYHIFNARLYAFNNSEPCLVCSSANTELATGIFELVENTIRFFAGPEISRERLAQLSSIVQDLRSGKFGLARAEREIRRSLPPLAKFLKRARRWGAAAAAVLIFVYGTLADWDSAVAQARDVQDYVRSIWQMTVVEQQGSVKLIIPTVGKSPP